MVLSFGHFIEHLVCDLFSSIEMEVFEYQILAKANRLCTTMQAY